MNILPWLLYPFQMILVLYKGKSLSVLNSFPSNFLWRIKRVRLKLTTLQRPFEEGGLAVPNIIYTKIYQIACLCSYIWHWFRGDPDSTWLTLEATPVAPIPPL